MFIEIYSTQQIVTDKVLRRRTPSIGMDHAVKRKDFKAKVMLEEIPQDFSSNFEGQCFLDFNWVTSKNGLILPEDRLRLLHQRKGCCKERGGLPLPILSSRQP